MSRFRKFLDEHGITLAQFASETGISKSYLSEISANHAAKAPSIDVAKKIARATRGAVKISDWPKFRAVFDAEHELGVEFADGEHQGLHVKKDNKSRARHDRGAA